MIPSSRNVHDIDSIQLVGAVRRMRDAGELINGKKLDTKNAHAGADFIQTQCVYDMPRFRAFMRAILADLALSV